MHRVSGKKQVVAFTAGGWRRIAPLVSLPSHVKHPVPQNKLPEQQAGDTKGTGKGWQRLKEHDSKGELSSKQLGGDAPAPEHTWALAAVPAAPRG